MTRQQPTPCHICGSLYAPFLYGHPYEVRAYCREHRAEGEAYTRQTRGGR